MSPDDFIAPLRTGGPSTKWQHRKLYDDVIKTLYALPEEFRTSLRIADFRATDIFTLNTALGASIEDAVVKGLNRLRQVWDAQGRYAVYRFERQAQAFPDVRLVTDAPNEAPVLMGIELKGWFALSKEGEPTFRYVITPKACADADLLVVYPWVLGDVVAGSPRLLHPFVCEARFAAQLRNWYWQTMRTRQHKNGEIITAQHQTPYPALKTDACSDRAVDDGGGNFGRIARYGLLDDFVSATAHQELSGIPIRAWLRFFKIFSDNTGSPDVVDDAIERALRRYQAIDVGEADALIAVVERMLAMLKNLNH